MDTKTNKITISEEDSKICKIDGKVFNSNREMVWYARKTYMLSFEEYIIKCYYNGIRPICLASGDHLTFKGHKLGPWFADYGKNKAPKKKHTEETKEKIRIGCEKNSIEKFGVKNVFESDWCKEKIKETNLNKFGAENPMQSENIKNKNRYNQLTTFYKRLTDENDRNNSCKPLFTLMDYNGVFNGNLYKFECKTCKEVFECTIDDGRLPRCIKCFPLSRSNQEIEVYDFLKQNFPNDIIEISVKGLLTNNKEIDIYFPNKRIGIEFDGIYWHSELSGRIKNYHLDKTTECEKRGIRLIHIFENEWENKKDIVKNKLLNILGQSRTNKIYARKCEIRVPPASDKIDFLAKNHVQGNDSSSIYYGLYHNDKLVSLMTFGQNRIVTGNKHSVGHYELIRYCSLLDSNVLGGAGKLFSHFKKQHDPIKVITYADKRWSSSSKNLYEAIGFSLVDVTPPNYFYFIRNKTLTLYHRFNFRKGNLGKKLEKFDENLSEWENMKNNGYDRIWDCGHLKYEYTR